MYLLLKYSSDYEYNFKSNFNFVYIFYYDLYSKKFLFKRKSNKTGNVRI